MESTRKASSLVNQSRASDSDSEGTHFDDGEPQPFRERIRNVCYCGQTSSFGEMVACDDLCCRREWVRRTNTATLASRLTVRCSFT